MPGMNPAKNGNALLDAFPRATRRRLMPDCSTVQLQGGSVLALAGERTQYVYFPTRGSISLTAPVDGTAWLGIGLIGDEGMLDIHTLLGLDISPVNAEVVAESEALRIETDAFLRQLVTNGGLRQALNRYCYVRLSEIVRASACNRFHSVEQRLARRLLVMQDRAHSDRFHITQEALARLLGVRRPAVNVAASAFQEQALIHYRRGDMRVLDRAGLLAISCSCYGADLAVYERLMEGC